MPKVHNIPKSEWASFKKSIKQIVNSNNVKSKNKLVELLLKGGQPRYLTYHYNIDIAMAELNLVKEGRYYKIVDAKAIQENTETKECWRCEQFRKFIDFPSGVTYTHVRLNICKVCLKEENRITGESIQELIGIYSYLQYRYKNVLEKWMYNRFWELALYGRSSSVSSQST